MNQVEKTAWEVSRKEGRIGVGTWLHFNVDMEVVHAAAEDWRQQVSGIERPWLCWNLHHRWCLLQQRLVAEMGWTPVVGWDPNCGQGRPPLIEGAVAINFNERFRFPVLFLHVPLEFMFLWCERLAFWHADLLLPRGQLRQIVDLFEGLDDGEMAAVFSYGGVRNILKHRRYRFWELIGCTTRGASRDNFRTGCGWWKHIFHHINCPQDPKEIARRKKYWDDHGCGIRYWKKYYGGKVYAIPERQVAKGHFSVIGRKHYIRGKSKSEEMDLNFDLDEIAKEFGIDDLLEDNG